MLIALTSAGCGGDDDEAAPETIGREATVTLTQTTPTPLPQPAPKPKPKGADTWSDEIVEPYSVSKRDVYELSRDLCSAFTPRQVAREYDAVAATPQAAAHAYAQTSYSGSHPLLAPAEAGCLAGFR